MLLLGVAVVMRGRASLVSLLFLTITVTAAGWLGCFSVMYASDDPGRAIFWARLGDLFAALITPAVFHFSALHVGQRRKQHKLILGFWIVLWIIGSLTGTTDVFIPAVRRFEWGFYPVEPWYGAGRMLLYGAILGASIRLFWHAYRTHSGQARQRALGLLIAFAVGSFGLIDFLPTIGLDIYPLGFLGILAFVVLAANAIWRYELVDLTQEYAAGQILETMKSAVLVVDLEGKIRVANRAASILLGYRDTELRGQHIRTIVDPGENMTTGQLLNSMGVLEQNMVWRTNAGGRVDVLASSSFVRDSEGSPVGVVYVAADFTERRRAEQALRESENRYRTLFDSNPLPMWVYDFETLQFIAVNDAAVKHYGYSHDEFLRMKISDIRPIEEVPNMLRALADISPRKGPRVFRHKKKDNTLFDAEISSFEFLSARRRTRLVMARDVTERNRAEEMIRESEERYRSLVELSPDAIFLHTDRKLIFVNKAAMKLLGATSPDQLIGHEILEFVHGDYRGLVGDRLRDLYEGTSVPLVEEKFLRLDGSTVEVEVAALSFMYHGRQTIQVVARDTSERKEIETRFRLLFERNLAGVYRTTLSGGILDCNDAMARMFGYDARQDLLQHSVNDLYFEPEERERIIEVLREQKSLTNHEAKMRRKDGSVIWVLENVSLLEGRTRDADVLEGTLIDITDRKTAHEQIEYQAYHDVLTGLPNRLLFRDRIGMSLAHARRTGRAVAVMFLDLDQFKLVNDTLGHTIGDGLLQAVASRLVNCVRAEDTVARMGGDEFTVLLSDIPEGKASATVAQKVLDAVSQRVIVDGHELFVTTSIGIAIFPEDGLDAETLLKNADSAMYRAKEMGRNNFQFATPSAFVAMTGRLSLEQSLHRAVDRQEFVVHYQPMIEIGTGKLVGAEALIRWQHPEHGLMNPEDFIPVAEESRLIIPMGEWVLRTACRQMKKWHDMGHRLRVAVNLSPRQFQQRELAAEIGAVLEETGLPPEFLELEITEGAAMQNAELSLTIMKRLKEMGVRLSIDDFGTGYSSLSYLKRFPIDTVKIDQNFVRDVAESTSDGAIISAVISMARALDLRVVAEGVETEEQRAFLEKERCAEIQGFLYSRPLPAEEFEKQL